MLEQGVTAKGNRKERQKKCLFTVTHGSFDNQPYYETRTKSVNHILFPSSCCVLIIVVCPLQVTVSRETQFNETLVMKIRVGKREKS